MTTLELSKRQQGELELFDLCAIIKAWAINTFATSRTKAQKKVKIEDLSIRVNWDDLISWSDPAVYSDQNCTHLPKSSVLFNTNFRNNTESEQEYNFRTERSTRSTAEIEISKGFTYHKEFGLKMKDKLIRTPLVEYWLYASEMTTLELSKRQQGELELFDLCAIIKAWAINTFATSRTKAQKKVKIEDLSIRVNWDDLISWSDPAVYSDQNCTHLPKSSVLFNTNFRNNTESEQEYNFRTERSTRSTAEIEISKGFALHKEFGLSLKLPNELLEASAGFSHEISLNQATRQSVEEELVWGVDTRVLVQPNRIAEAEVTVSEERMTCKFRVDTHVYGRVRATILDGGRDNAFLKYMDGDLALIVEEYLRRPGPKGKSPISNVTVKELNAQQKQVVITTEGCCTFRFGVKQNVEVNQLLVT